MSWWLAIGILWVLAVVAVILFFMGANGKRLR